MRLWHYQLLPYLPNLQFKGQLRELVAIMHDWRDKGSTNHLLINKVMDYPKSALDYYWAFYYNEYQRRYGKKLDKYEMEFIEFTKNSSLIYGRIYENWHNKEYLRICMANLYEKYKYGKGKSKISDIEWNTLLIGYRKITGEEYSI